MKKGIKDFLLGLLVVVFILGVLIISGYSDTHYSCQADVYNVNDTSTVFIDGAGYLWEVSDTNYHKGETVKIKFDNNCTDYTRNDDVILKVIKND